jgi:translation initiation factor 2B subunit (eIF-2B alpha/beta/delta family)
MTALENELINPDLDPSGFIRYIEYMRTKMETFTLIRHFCDELMLSHNVSFASYPTNYLDFIREYKEYWEKTPSGLMANLKKELNLQNKIVMLHSNSGSLREVFRLLYPEIPSIKFFQTISSPAEEGRIQAHDLAGIGYKVTLIPDALTAEKLKETDYLILSADQVREKTIVNKIGSLQMVLAAQEFGVPVIVLTDSRKSNQGDLNKPFKDKKRSEKEILFEIVHPNLNAENIYFEEVPRYMISKLITERKTFDENE